MDGDRFDTFTKQLATPPTRRRVIQALGGALAGTLLGGRVAAADTCKANGKVCKKDSQCCSGYCQGGTGTGSTAHSNGFCAPPPCTATPNGGSCAADSDCCSGICQFGTCVATAAGTCTAAGDTCGNGHCGCVTDGGGALLCVGSGLCGGTISSQANCDTGTYFFEFPDGNKCCLAPPCPPQGCFTGETRIAMADGTSKPIELVAIGDLVLGRGGVNRVLDIDRPRLGGQPLFAFNGGPAFVTANHPFLSATGWTAIDPVAAMAVRPTVAVRRLTVGARLLTLAGVPVPAGGAGAGNPIAPRMAAMTVASMAVQVANPATPIYDLRVDGDHTYFANDLLVHNK